MTDVTPEMPHKYIFLKKNNILKFQRRNLNESCVIVDSSQPSLRRKKAVNDTIFLIDFEKP